MKNVQKRQGIARVELLRGVGGGAGVMRGGDASEVGVEFLEGGGLKLAWTCMGASRARVVATWASTTPATTQLSRHP